MDQARWCPPNTASRLDSFRCPTLKLPPRRCCPWCVPMLLLARSRSFRDCRSLPATNINGNNNTLGGSPLCPGLPSVQSWLPVRNLRDEARETWRETTL